MKPRAVVLSRMTGVGACGLCIPHFCEGEANGDGFFAVVENSPHFAVVGGDSNMCEDGGWVEDSPIGDWRWVVCGSACLHYGGKVKYTAEKILIVSYF